MNSVEIHTADNLTSLLCACQHITRDLRRKFAPARSHSRELPRGARLVSQRRGSSLRCPVARSAALWEVVIVVGIERRQRRIPIDDCAPLLRGHRLLHRRGTELMLEHLFEARAVERVALQQLRDQIERLLGHLAPSGVVEGEIGRVDGSQQLVLAHIGGCEGEAAAQHDMEAHSKRPDVRLGAVRQRRLR